jgi:two-component system, LytTR family, sensor kinase
MLMKTAFMQINFKTLAWHLLFWFCLFLYEWLPLGSANDKYEGYFWSALINIPIFMAATYFTIFVTVEKFLLKKKTLMFLGTLAATLVIFGVTRRCVNYTYTYPILYPDKCYMTPMFYLPKIIIDGVFTHLVAGLGAMIYVVRRIMEQQTVNEALMREKVAAQLELLKSQVQPHFIFNTLNNIYMLSLKNSPQTSDMIYRLSALLSYMLYDSKQETIDIEKEIEYIKNYINLEKIRYGERLDVQLNIFGDFKNVRIPPLLILPLVENAFKHGASNTVENSWIHIDIAQKQNILTLKIENSLKEKSESHSTHSGLGLENLRKRLEIIYPEGHEMKLLEEDNTFLVSLKIDLKTSEKSAFSSSIPSLFTEKGLRKVPKMGFELRNLISIFKF